MIRLFVKTVQGCLISQKKPISAKMIAGIHKSENMSNEIVNDKNPITNAMGVRRIVKQIK